MSGFCPGRAEGTSLVDNSVRRPKITVSAGGQELLAQTRAPVLAETARGLPGLGRHLAGVAVAHIPACRSGIGWLADITRACASFQEPGHEGYRVPGPAAGMWPPNPGMAWPDHWRCHAAATGAPKGRVPGRPPPLRLAKMCTVPAGDERQFPAVRTRRLPAASPGRFTSSLVAAS